MVRNGKSRCGAPNFLCRGRGRNFVTARRKGLVSEGREQLSRLLTERLCLRAIARAVGVSRSWLQSFVNELYREETPWEPAPSPKKGPGAQILKADEMWSFAGSRREVW